MSEKAQVMVNGLGAENEGKMSRIIAGGKDCLQCSEEKGRHKDQAGNDIKNS